MKSTIKNAPIVIFEQGMINFDENYNHLYMKKLFLFLALLNVTSLFANPHKKIREFYNPETKHEIGAGIGWWTFTNFLNSDFSCIDDWKPIDEEYSYTPAFNVHYYYKLHRRVKLGMDVTWQKNKRNYVFSTEKYENGINDFNRRLEEARGTENEEFVKSKLEEYQQSYDDWQNHCGLETYNHLILTPQVKLTWLSREHFAIYQRYGIGLDLEFNKSVNGEKNTWACPSPCAALLGLEFGGGKFRGYFETIELSAQGLFHGGIKFDF